MAESKSNVVSFAHLRISSKGMAINNKETVTGLTANEIYPQIVPVTVSFH